jgi:hypothetical protein
MGWRQVGANPFYLALLIGAIFVAFLAIVPSFRADLPAATDAGSLLPLAGG